MVVVVDDVANVVFCKLVEYVDLQFWQIFVLCIAVVWMLQLSILVSN